MFRLIAATDPDHRFAEDAFYRLFSRELDTGFGPRARGYLGELLGVGVGDTAIGTTVVRLGTDEYLRGNYDEAAVFFEAYLVGGRNATTRQQAGYWAALSHAARGETESATSLLASVAREDPFTFYGALAGERVGAPVLDAGLVEGPPRNPSLEAPFANAVTRILVMRLVPTPGSLAYELERTTEYAQGFPSGRYDLAESFIDGGLALQAIVLGREIQRDEEDWNLRLLRIVHPFPHRETVVRQAGSLGLNPFLVAGLIRQESAWDAAIMSSAGAVGLMQLMPPTAREVAGSLGVGYSEADLRNPETNVVLGTTYLASMVRRFERVEGVLSAYNAGPGRMRQWEGQAAYRDTDVFTEQIPFDETRNYVKSIQRYARVYAALYGCGDFEPCLGQTYTSIVASNPSALGAPRTVIHLD
jgi:soluble lytic murein transglycosylase